MLKVKMQLSLFMPAINCEKQIHNLTPGNWKRLFRAPTGCHANVGSCPSSVSLEFWASLASEVPGAYGDWRRGGSGGSGRGGTQERFQEQRRYVFGYQANSRTSFWAMCVGVWFWFLSISILAFKLKISLFVGLAVGLLHIKQQKFSKILLMSNCCFPVAVVVNDWLAT